MGTAIQASPLGQNKICCALAHYNKKSKCCKTYKKLLKKQKNGVVAELDAQTALQASPLGQNKICCALAHYNKKSKCCKTYKKLLKKQKNGAVAELDAQM